MGFTWTVWRNDLRHRGSNLLQTKIDTRSQTETQIVGMGDPMPQVLWSLYFIQAQGYPILHALIYQDKRSAVLLETNGIFSSSKRTKHSR